jgi:hypothetical protein
LIQFHELRHRPVNLLLEDDRVVVLIPPLQFRLDRIAEIRGSQKPPIGACGFVVDCGNGVSERTLEPTLVLSTSLMTGRK